MAAAAQDEGKCRGSFSACSCPKGSNASAELCNGYCKACWNKERREYAKMAASKQKGAIGKVPDKCLDGKCPRNYNAKPELHIGFCQPCWDKYTRRFDAASKAAAAAAAAALKRGKAAAAATTKQAKPAAADPKTAAAKSTAVAGQKPTVMHSPAANADKAAAVKPASKVKQAPKPADGSSSGGTAGRQASNSRGDGPAAATRAQTKDKIPTAVRNQVWLLYMDNVAFGACPCCGVNEVSLTASGGFECGQVQAEAKGGKTCLGNLIPVCKSCNLGMKTENMMEYVQK